MLRTVVLILSLGIALPLFAQTAAYDPASADRARDAKHPPSVQELAFESAGSRINALMYVAQGPGPHPTVVLLHGYPGNERNLDLAQAMRRAGMNVLFFSYRGAWGSGGTFSFANAQADVASALRFVRSDSAVRLLGTDPHRVALVGHSMGGWLAFLGAAADSDVTCVGGIEVGDMALEVRDSTQAADFLQYTQWLTQPGAPLQADAGALTGELKANAAQWTLPAHASELRTRPILLLDNGLNRNHAELVRALRAAGATKLTEMVWQNTDHSFSDRRIALARTVVGWLHRSCGF
jgi:pimeloyl-ACP methyl ester carboxylesterase